MTRRPLSGRAGIAAMVVGIVLALGAMLADRIGLGQYPDVFGPAQVLGLSAGAILFMLGLAVRLWADH